MTADGTTTLLNKQPCDKEWDQCIGKDVVSRRDANGIVLAMKIRPWRSHWICGSTKQWYTLAM